MRSQRCARLCQSVCRRWLAQGNRVSPGEGRGSVRWGSTPCYSRVRIPPYVGKRIASGLDLSFGTQKRYAEVRFRVRERFFQKATIIRARIGKPRFPIGAMQRRLCLRADTVFSQTAPKDLFPRRDGDTQALSRRFCVNDGEAKFHWIGESSPCFPYFQQNETVSVPKVQIMSWVGVA